MLIAAARLGRGARRGVERRGHRRAGRARRELRRRAALDKTLVFVSTERRQRWRTGAREFARSYPERDLIDAAIVISQPGAAAARAAARAPVVERTSRARRSSSPLTADDGGRRADRPAGRRQGLFGEPAAARAAERARRAGAADRARASTRSAISAAGERPLPPARGRHRVAVGCHARRLRPRRADDRRSTLDAASRARRSTGRATYVTIGGQPDPGLVDRPARARARCSPPRSRRSTDARARGAAARAAHSTSAGSIGRSLPFLAALLLAYLLALTGLAPSPEFPYDPGASRSGGGRRSSLVILATRRRAWSVIRPLTVPRRGRARGPRRRGRSRAVRLRRVVWLVNPYLALFCVPVAHVWLAAIGPGGPARRAGIAAAIVVARDPAAGPDRGSRRSARGRGRDSVAAAADGHGRADSFAAAVLGCLVAGAVVALVAAALAPEEAAAVGPRIAARGPG